MECSDACDNPKDTCYGDCPKLISKLGCTDDVKKLCAKSCDACKNGGLDWLFSDVDTSQMYWFDYSCTN